MLRKDVWVALSTAVASPDDIAGLLPDHLKRMIELEQQGVLFASGPLLDDDGSLTGDGVTIIRAGTRAEAEDVMRSDPLVSAGVRTVEVRRWRIMEGRVAVTLDFSDGGYALD
jgi:hypothetical protein